MLLNAGLPHHFEEKRPLVFALHGVMSNLLNNQYQDFLTMQNGFSFSNPSDAFLKICTFFIEFLEVIDPDFRNLAMNSFLLAFQGQRTYDGFNNALIGLFGIDATATYIETAPMTLDIEIRNIDTNFFQLLMTEDYYSVIVTEDMQSRLRTEDQFIKPENQDNVQYILEYFLPAGLVYEIRFSEDGGDE